MSIPLEKTFIAKTHLGIFSVSVKTEIGIDYESRNVVQKGTIIRVGGKKSDCVFIQVPMNSVVGQFTRLDAMDGCTLDFPYSVGGEKTVEMVKLAMTIAKETNPQLQSLTLQDSASFPCKLSNGKYYRVNSTDYDMFFYKQSYYEKRYGATLINPTLRKLYEETIPNFSNPDNKSVEFDFLEPTLQEQLDSVYKQTTTWKEFADAISEIWPEKKCTVVYIWLKTALSRICNSVSFAGQDWEITLSDKNMVKYEILQKGGKRTRKNINRYESNKKTKLFKIFEYPPPSEYLAMDWVLKK